MPRRKKLTDEQREAITDLASIFHASGVCKTETRNQEVAEINAIIDLAYAFGVDLTDDDAESLKPWKTA